MLLLNKISDLLSLGIDVKFRRALNQFSIELSMEGVDLIKQNKSVTLPFDHLSEKRICEYIDLMKNDFDFK